MSLRKVVVHHLAKNTLTEERGEGIWLPDSCSRNGTCFLIFDDCVDWIESDTGFTGNQKEQNMMV